MSSQENKKTFIANLWERRFFQFLATYIATSWGSIQVMDWVVKRYGLPSEWVDKLVILLLTLLPFICSFTYFHGRVGDDKWLKFEKIFYPINIVVALMLSIFLVDGSANSITEEVTLTDMKGETIIREVPKQEFNKRVVVFPIEGVPEGKSWMKVGLSELLNNKLEQDMMILVTSAISISDSYEHYGYEHFREIPFATKVNISVEDYSDFFVDSGFVDGSEDKVEVKVYETESGKELAQEIVEGSDIFELTERMSEVINREIKLSQVEGKELYIDLPARNLISSDTAALRSYIEAVILISISPNKLTEAYGLMDNAVKIDPTCAECWSSMALVKLLSGQDQGDEMNNALKYVENLPERQQLGIKLSNYLAKNDIEKGIKLCKMWRKLYPQDSKPVSKLISLYRGLFRLDEAKEVAKKAIDDGHRGGVYMTYANLLVQSKDWEQAEIYLKKYKETYPKQFEATSLLVDTYAGKGQMEKAMEALDELILMKPLDNSYQLKKASLLSKQNKFEDAIETLNDALSNTNIVGDSIGILAKQLEVYNRAMKYEKYRKLRKELKDLFIAHYPPIQYLQTEYSTVGFYKNIDQVDSIEYYIKDITSKVAPSRRKLVADVNEFIIKIFKEDTVQIEESFAKVKPMFEAMGNDFFVLLYSSEIKYNQGKYEEALALYAKCYESSPDPSMISSNFHETHLKLGKNKEGLEIIDKLLEEDPLHPINNLFKSKFLTNLDEKSKAKVTLNKVIDVFREADPRCIYVKDAVELAETLDL